VRCDNRRLGAIRTDTIVVPAGSACRLDGPRVDGSIEVEAGARLEAYDIELRSGKVRASGAAQVVLGGRSFIAGSVRVAGGGEVEVADARIAGDLRCPAAATVWSGTSMAASLAAGVAALVWARNPDWKPVDVTKRLLDRSRPLCDTGIRGLHAAGAVLDFVPEPPACD
jgi:subtilisin family serine protease